MRTCARVGICERLEAWFRGRSIGLERDPSETRVARKCTRYLAKDLVD